MDMFQFEKRGITLEPLCQASKKYMYMMHIYPSYGSNVASFIGMTWKLWKRFGTQPSSIMDL